MAEQPQELEAIKKTTGAIGSRFETQVSIDQANALREKEWKDAYARIGQEPPKPEEIPYDGRTLYERLQINEQLKKEEWDEKMKLGNQYRGLDNEEMAFLRDKAIEQAKSDRERRERENEEMQTYREALAAKQAAAQAVEPPLPSAAASSSTAKRAPPKAVKKDVKSLLKGVVVKKKPKAAPSSEPAKSTSTKLPLTGEDIAAPKAAGKREAEESDETEKETGKKQRLDP